MTSTPDRPKAVIFDFGGVFTDSPLARFDAFESAHQLPSRFLAHTINAQPDHGAFGRFERGEMSLDTFDTAFLDETSATGHPVRGRTLVSLLTLQLRPAVVHMHQALIDAGYATACITNNTPGSRAADWVVDETSGALRRVMDAFDVVIESAAEGLRKPEPAIYALACDRLQLAPTDCVFLDDLGINLKPARALGMRTIKVPEHDWESAFGVLADVTGVPYQRTPG